jgi:hypothetical protein
MVGICRDPVPQGLHIIDLLLDGEFIARRRYGKRLRHSMSITRSLQPEPAERSAAMQDVLECSRARWRQRRAGDHRRTRQASPGSRRPDRPLRPGSWVPDWPDVLARAWASNDRSRFQRRTTDQTQRRGCSSACNALVRPRVSKRDVVILILLGESHNRVGAA